MTTLQEIFIDINGANRYVTVSAKAEDDAGRIVLINLLDNGALYALPADAEARAVMIRPNGTKALITAQVIEGKVQLTMKSSMLILGTSQVEILLSTADGKVITTAKFAVKVHGTQSTAGMKQSDDWSALRDALSKLSQVPAAEDVATLKAAVALVNGRLQKQAQTTHIQAVLAAKFTPTAEGTYEAPVYLNLSNAARQYGTALTLSNGGVKIGKGVRKVRVTGQAYMYESSALTQCEVNLFIVKADGTATRIERCICTRSGKYETYITGPIVTAVSEGDIIKLAYIGKPDTSFINYNDATMLNVTVEEWDLSTAAGADLSADDVLLNKWHTGTTIDGAAGSETTYPASGISSAFIGDLYLNLSTGTVYQCTATGTADKATWKYMAVLSNVGDGTVQAKHLAEGAALGNIGLNSITSAKIADGAITSAKIAYGGVEQDNIKDGAVTTPKIAAASVKAYHIDDECISKAKLTPALQKEIGAGGIGGITDGAVTEAKLADGSVTTNKLADSAVTGEKVKSLTLEGKHLKPRTIQAIRIALGTLTENLLSKDLQSKLTSYVGTFACSSGDIVTLDEWYIRSDFDPFVVNVDYDTTGTVTLHADDAKSGDHALTLRSGALVSFFEENGTECAVITQSDFGVAVVRRAADGSGTVTKLFGGVAELGSSVVLNTHTEYRGGELATLAITLPATIQENYTARLVFESGATATTLSYPADTIKFIGDGCDSEGDFVPAASTAYEVDIKYLGTNSAGAKRIVARVGAF